MTSLPEWMRSPRLEGWYADDLDHLPETPRHTELIDGALVFMVSPQRVWHARMITALVNSLTDQAPAGIEVDREITIELDRPTRSRFLFAHRDHAHDLPRPGGRHGTGIRR